MKIEHISLFAPLFREILYKWG